MDLGRNHERLRESEVMRYLICFALAVSSSNWSLCVRAEIIAVLGQDEHGCIAYMRDGVTYAECRPNAFTSSNFGSTCEQRMREAMKSVDLYVRGREELHAHIRGWRMGSVIQDQWTETMKDCVIGK